jgi:hypothetical protein
MNVPHAGTRAFGGNDDFVQHGRRLIGTCSPRQASRRACRDENGGRNSHAAKPTGFFSAMAPLAR